MAKEINTTSKHPPYFWWILAHALAVCFCALSWLLTTQIFKYPELSRNYLILKKLGRAPKLMDFTELEAPNGESIKPEHIYKKYAALANAGQGTRKEKMNRDLLRAYLQNYSENTKPIYIEGRYRVLQVRPLTNKDLYFPGFVIRAQALVPMDKMRPESPYPVIIEYMYPSSNKAAFTWTKPGDILEIKKIPNCASIIHVDMLGTTDEPMINLTVTPIAYGINTIGTDRSFTTSPPQELNLSAKLPAFEGKIIEDSP